MTASTNREILERAMGKFSPGTLETYLQLYHPEAKLHFLPPGPPPGRDGARLFYTSFFAAFPDVRLVADDFVSEGDKIAVRFTVEATHQGEFMGVPATGKRISFTGITILLFAGGQCIERWSEANFLGLLQQIGTVATPA